MVLYEIFKKDNFYSYFEYGFTRMLKWLLKDINEGLNFQHFIDNIYSQFGSAEEISLPIIPAFPNVLANRAREAHLIASDNFFFVKAHGKENSFLLDMIYTFGIKYSNNPEKQLYIFTDNPVSQIVPDYVHIINVPNKKEEIYNALVELKKKLKPEPPQIIAYPIYNYERKPDEFDFDKKSYKNLPGRHSKLKGLPDLIYKIVETLR